MYIPAVPQAFDPFRETNELATRIGALAIFETGSRVICPDHVRPNSDWDSVILVQRLTESVEKFRDRDFVLGGSLQQAVQDGEIQEGTKFLSLRKGPINLIVTQDKEFFEKFVWCTREATIRKLTNKEERVAFFNSVCDQ